MKLFSKASDGGKDSGVTAYFAIEWKRFFSVALLHFKPGTREAYHDHAFNAWTFWLKGDVVEHRLLFTENDVFSEERAYKAGDLKFTPRTNMHKIIAGPKGAWCFTIRGPWVDRWHEWRRGERVTLTHGRKEITE